MKKRVLSLVLSGALVIGMLTGCGSTATSSTANTSMESAGSSAKVNVSISLGNASDYYIGTMVGENVKKAFEEAGATVQVLDGADNVATQVDQIQNAVTSGANIIYVFPAGDGASYADVLTSAKEAGIKTIMSNNYPGDDVVDCYVGNDEFQMGVMMAKMVSDWADKVYPDAGAGEVHVLALEAGFNENSIKRCIGMRMVGEKFLRTADTATVGFVKNDSDSVTYLDAEGKEQQVDEPTGGLILDKDGHAQLNPYYNEKITIVTYSDRNKVGTDATEAQKAIENTITNGENNLNAIMAYGDVGAASDTKAQELIESGKITTSADKFAVFCSDLTDTNEALIKDSSSLLKGVMASGDLITTIQEDAKKMVAGEDVEAYTMMPLSYIVANDDGSDIKSVYYTDCDQLPDTTEFFQKS